MDLRTHKTRRSIINAFLQLRSKKPVEKISVKELSALAEINKATFYLHFHDIYDLSENLERDVVRSCMNGIQHPEDVFRDTRRFIKEMSDSLAANEQLIKLLFEGSRSSNFVTLFSEELTAVIRTAYPRLRPRYGTEYDDDLSYMRRLLHLHAVLRSGHTSRYAAY